MDFFSPIVFYVLLGSSFLLFGFWFWYAEAYDSKKVVMFEMTREELDALLEAREGMDAPVARRRPPRGWKRDLHCRREWLLIGRDGVWAHFGLPQLVSQGKYGDNVIMMTRTEFHPWDEISGVFMALVEREYMSGKRERLAALQFETRDLRVAVEADSLDFTAVMMAMVEMHAPHLKPDPQGPKILGIERLMKGPGLWPWTLLAGNAFKHTYIRERFPEEDAGEPSGEPTPDG